MRVLVLVFCVFTALFAASLASATTLTCDPGAYAVSVSSAKVRAAASTSAQQIALVLLNNDVPVTGGVEGFSVRGSTLWCEVSMVGNEVGYVHSSLLVFAPDAAEVEPLSFNISSAQTNVVPVDNSAANATTTPPPPVVSTPVPVVQNSFVCPSNCAGAVAMGLSPEQAATCPGLDRDRDGVACYGD